MIYKCSEKQLSVVTSAKRSRRVRTEKEPLYNERETNDCLRAREAAPQMAMPLSLPHVCVRFLLFYKGVRSSSERASGLVEVPPRGER